MGIIIVFELSNEELRVVVLERGAEYDESIEQLGRLVVCGSPDPEACVASLAAII